MPLPSFVIWIVFVAILVPGAGGVYGQDYPTKPIRIVTSGVGGGSDFAARLVAQGISGALGQPVIVDNRPSGVIPGQVVSAAAPDGYTLLLGSNSLWVGPLMQNTPYDAVRDFAPVTMTTRAPLLVVVHPSLPVRSVRELVALAKARPGELNYGTGAIGASTHLAAELFKAMAGVNIVRITYKSNSVQMADLVGGHVQLTFGSGGTVSPHVKTGKLRALAVTSAGPSAVAPGLPTVAASGVPGFELVAVDGIFAPAKTPVTIINRLNQDIVRFLATPEAKERFLSSATEASGSSPEEFAARIKSEIAKLSKLIKDADIRVE